MLNIDSAARLGSQSQLRDLIRAVLGASDADELWVGWKSGLDLTTKAGQFAVARAVLGFANRMPDDARRFAEGYAYVLVGVDIGSLGGVTEVDSEKLYPGIEQYCGPGGGGPRYHLTYVSFDVGAGEKQVLVVEVEPPRWGDPIFTLRKDFESTWAGTVFARRPGRTERANPREIEQLTERFCRQEVRLTMDIAEGVPIRAVQAGSEERESWLDDEAAAVRAAGPRQEAARDEAGEEEREAQVGFRLAQDFARQQELIKHTMSFASAFADPRTPADYQAQTEHYLTEAAAALSQAIRDGAAAHLVPLRLRLTNHTQQNLRELELILELPAGIDAALARPEPQGPLSRTA